MKGNTRCIQGLAPKTLTIRITLFFAMLSLLIATPVLPAYAAPSAADAATQDLTFNFGDFQSPGILAYPAGGGRYPTVILLHGNLPGDADYNAISPLDGQTLLSHIFKDIAGYLVPRGFAVLRYNQHYVTSATNVDAQKYYTTPRQQFLKDAETVLAAAETNPHVDPRHIYIYGFSEGSVIGANLVAAHPEVAGLIMQGMLGESWAETFRYQAVDDGLAYALQFAPDGKITAATLQQAWQGPGGVWAKGNLLGFLIDPRFTGAPDQKIAVNPDLDTNKDGVLEADTEVRPAVDPLINAQLAPGGPFELYGPSKGLPIPTDLAAQLKEPVLILQGANDGAVPPAGAQRFDAALAANGNHDHTLKLYPGLGHSLGPASGPSDDNFRPIVEQPMQDLVAWLQLHTSATTPGMPRTGGDGANAAWLLVLGALCLAGGLALRLRAHRALAR
jgi:dienelactone hydrolase